MRLPRLPFPFAALFMALAATFLVACGGESAGPEEATTLSDIAERPQEFDGQQVTVSGEVAENEYLSLDDARLAFVIGEDAGKKVVVLPQEGVSLPQGLDDTSVVRVRGTVQAVPANEKTEGGFLDQGGILAKSDAQVSIKAEAVTVPGGDLQDAPNEPLARTGTVEQLVEDPEAWDEKPVLVPGTVVEVLENGFILAGENESIFVDAPSSDLSGLESGERVRIRGELARFSPFRADDVERQIEKIDADRRVRSAPLDEGDPYLLLRVIREGEA